MTEYYEQINTAEHVQMMYDGIFFGLDDDPQSMLPIRYNAVALNGTKKPDFNYGDEIYTGTRYGVFLDAFKQSVQYSAILVTDTSLIPSEEDVLKSIKDCTLLDNDLSSVEPKTTSNSSVSNLLGEFRKYPILHQFPIALISGWNESRDGDFNKNICLHYPNIAHPKSVLKFLQTVADRELRMSKVIDNIPISFATISDGTADYVGLDSANNLTVWPWI